MDTFEEVINLLKQMEEEGIEESLNENSSDKTKVTQENNQQNETNDMQQNKEQSSKTKEYITDEEFKALLDGVNFDEDMSKSNQNVQKEAPILQPFCSNEMKALILQPFTSNEVKAPQCEAISSTSNGPTNVQVGIKHFSFQENKY